jgi:hypothetical protein
MVLLGLVIAGFLCIAIGPAQSPQPRKPPDNLPKNVEANAGQVDQLVAQRDKLGTNLLRVLQDTNVPSQERGQAARALGKLGYKPAIPVLIKLIELEDWPPDKPILELPSIREMCPCVAALQDFGIEPVPQLLDAYLSEANSRRRSLIGASFAEERVVAVINYVRGAYASAKEGPSKKRLAELLRDLATVDPRKEGLLLQLPLTIPIR